MHWLMKERKLSQEDVESQAFASKGFTSKTFTPEAFTPKTFTPKALTNHFLPFCLCILFFSVATLLIIVSPLLVASPVNNESISSASSTLSSSPATKTLSPDTSTDDPTKAALKTDEDIDDSSLSNKTDIVDDDHENALSIDGNNKEKGFFAKVRNSAAIRKIKNNKPQTNAILGAIAGGIITSNPAGVILGGVIGGLASKKGSPKDDASDLAATGLYDDLTPPRLKHKENYKKSHLKKSNTTTPDTQSNNKNSTSQDGKKTYYTKSIIKKENLKIIGINSRLDSSAADQWTPLNLKYFERKQKHFTPGFAQDSSTAVDSKAIMPATENIQNTAQTKPQKPAHAVQKSVTIQSSKTVKPPMPAGDSLAKKDNRIRDNVEKANNLVEKNPTNGSTQNKKTYRPARAFGKSPKVQRPHKKKAEQVITKSADKKTGESENSLQETQTTQIQGSPDTCFKRTDNLTRKRPKHCFYMFY